MQPAHSYGQHHAARFESELADLLKIPSVSTQPHHSIDVQRAAQWLVGNMERIGMTARIYERPQCLPLVYGEWTGAGADKPTVLIYSHYDVQPAEISDGWDTDPFTPILRDGRLFARGAVDSKSHVIIQMKAAECVLATAAKAEINIKLLFEGEEESGGRHIAAFVAENADLLRADAIVVSDGSLPDENQPVLVYGLRGIITMELEVTGPQRDLHSGHFGGTVHNPILALGQMLTQFHDDKGRVRVPGFYDEVQILDGDERALLAKELPFAEGEWRAVANAPAQWGDPDFTLNERIGARPTLEMNGISGGYAGEGFKTVLPNKALAKVSCRLVPRQTPMRVFEQVRQFVQSITPPTVRAELRLLEDGGSGIVLDRNTPPMQAAAEAYRRAWGVEPIYTREGGSIPVVSVFLQHHPAPVVLMPFGYKGGGAHGPNEYVVLDMFHKGIRAALYFYEILAEQHTS
jgi:acetylornithine deacetylase/succinyl-diaminopimelate desuccinylase-like protein